MCVRESIHKTQSGEFQKETSGVIHIYTIFQGMGFMVLYIKLEDTRLPSEYQISESS